MNLSNEELKRLKDSDIKNKKKVQFREKLVSGIFLVLKTILSAFVPLSDREVIKEEINKDEMIDAFHDEDDDDYDE